MIMRWKQWLGGLLALAVVACGGGGDDDDKGGGGSAITTGCVQGVVQDGHDGSRINLPAHDGNRGIYALVQADLKAAKPLTVDPAAAEHLRGEFTLCGIPLNETYPLFVWVDGYQAFEGRVTIRSTAASMTPQARQDILKPAPTLLANVSLFKVGTNVQPLEFNVVHNGAPLPDATVHLRPTGGNLIGLGASLTPASTRYAPLTLVTDASGIATFPAESLVLGGQYTWVVLPPGGGVAHTAEQSAGVFTVGLRAGTDGTEPYRLTVDLEHPVGDLFELSRSTANQDPNPTGALVVLFNRAIEVVPGSLDGANAILSGATTAALETPVADNNAAEPVTITVAGNSLTLTPNYATQPATDTTTELNLAITYSGIRVRPAAPPRTANDYTVTGTVNYYQ